MSVSSRVYRSAPAPVGHYAAGRSVEVRLAQAEGITPGTAHQWLFGRERVNARCAAVVRAFLEAGQPDRARVWLREIFATLEGRATPAFSRDLILAAQEADADEDLAETAHHLSPTPDNARAWIRALRRESALLAAEADALEAKLHAEASA